MTSTFFQRILLLVLLAGCMTGLHAQEYKYEIGGMAGGAFYMGDVNKNAFFKGLNPAFGAVFRYSFPSHPCCSQHQENSAARKEGKNEGVCSQHSINKWKN